MALLTNDDIIFCGAAVLNHRMDPPFDSAPRSIRVNQSNNLQASQALDCRVLYQISYLQDSANLMTFRRKVATYFLPL